MKLRPFQQEAINEIKKHDKGIIVLPTGTGKTIIEGHSLAEFVITDSVTSLVEHTGEGIYLVSTPKIVLVNQIAQNIYRQLDQKNINAHYVLIHSGYGSDPLDAVYVQENMNFAKSKTEITTQRKEVYQIAQSAKKMRRPLICFSTYDSASVVLSQFIPEVWVCDEAHHLAGEFEKLLRLYSAKRSYFFTATPRGLRGSVEGSGMANETRFGKIIYVKTNKEMIEAGEMVGPQVIVIDTKDENYVVDDKEEDAADIKTIFKTMDVLDELLGQKKLPPKLLVAAKGSGHIRNIISSPTFVEYRSQHPNLYVFDISSEYGPNICNGNGIRQKVNRNKFMKELKRVGEDDKLSMVVLHIDILTEGIDVPGINGILFFDSKEEAEFCQMVGRGARLHPTDRANLYTGTLTSEQIDGFLKPKAYVFVPMYGPFGVDNFHQIEEICRNLESYGFVPQSDLRVYSNRGTYAPYVKNRGSGGDSSYNKTFTEELIARMVDIWKRTEHMKNIHTIKTMGDDMDKLLEIWCEV